MFEKITEVSHQFLQSQIDELRTTCDKDPRVAEMVRYIIAYSDQMAYSNGDEDAEIGRQIIQHIWEINGGDLSNIGNKYHFNPSWAYELNSFIGNFVYDDSGFDFEVTDFNGTIEFKYAGDDDRWLQNPSVIVEAAKANHAYYKLMDSMTLEDRRGRAHDKADISKVLELINE